MPRPGKRKVEVVDLTGVDDYEESTGHQPKSAKSAVGSSQNQQYASNHAAASSSFRSSQGSTQQYPSGRSQDQPNWSQSSQRYGGSSHQSPYSSAGHQYLPPSQQERNTWSATQERQFEDDMRREIDLTQDDDDHDAYENRQLYGIMNTKIVGVRFYTGRATVGEYVSIRREPSNPYDSNAIRIDNVVRDQIGHIGRGVAAKLAPFLDSGDLVVEGALTGEKGQFDCPIALKLFGTTDPVQSAILKRKMQAERFPVSELVKSENERKKRTAEMEKQRKAREKAASSMRKGGNVVFDNEGPNKYANLNRPGEGNAENVPALEDLLGAGTSTFNPREVQASINTYALGEDQLARMDMADQPKMLSTSLLPYQRQGLKWMLDHESPTLPKRGSNEVVQLWKNVNGIYSNIATSFSVTKAPPLASGGILADDMGLGKTLQIISLIMADPKKNGCPTLIVAPLSVMSNWRDQAKTHVKTQFAPRVLIYHGQENRGLAPKQFQEYDVVVTTYQTMTMELFPFGKDMPAHVPNQKGLFSLEWRRIVLDEGHQIRNPKAKMARAACSLQAQSRWILSGTPIVNSLKDLYSHVKFLRLSGGLSEFEIFNANVIRPMKYEDPNAKALLQVLMQTMSLRRMKDMKFVDLKLPGVSFHRYPVQFLPHEQERYDAFKAEAKGLVEMAKEASNNRNKNKNKNKNQNQKGENTMTHLLEVLLRLRQTCNHWKMCGEERVAKLLDLIEENKIVDVMVPANRKALQDLLQLKMDNQEDCPVCMESLNDAQCSPVITACSHAFCRVCIEKVIETQHRCPMCRADLVNTDCLVSPSATGFGEDDANANANVLSDAESSSKIESLVKILKATPRDTKTVVFSQWTSFLDLLQAQLSLHGLPYTRLDGKMNATKRDAAIDSLNTDDDCRILLASLSVCSVGLNLVAASQVVLADSWWAPAIEDQAVDRVHRLGQTRRCKVVRLIVEGTVEDEVLEIQARKRKLAGMAFNEKKEKQQREEQRERRTGGGTLADIERLLQ